MQTNVLPDPAEVGRARRWARSRLLGSGIAADEPMAETLLLLISELVTNAVVHTGSPAVLRICLPDSDGDDAGTVRVEVADASDRPPAPRHARGDDTGGRGLELVDGLADRWGWQREGSGKHIWCEVDRGPCGDTDRDASADGAQGFGTRPPLGHSRPLGNGQALGSGQGLGHGRTLGAGAALGSGQGLGSGGGLGSGPAFGTGAAAPSASAGFGGGTGIGPRDRAGYLIATGATGLPTAPVNGSGVAASRNA